MADNRRRLAADARRVAVKGDDTRDTAREIRELLKRNYERGRDEGRTEAEGEHAATSARTALLETSADMLEQAMARTSSMPNSDRAQMAYREATAILRDAARRGEASPNGERPDKGERTAERG
jgi:hypothetical protein